MESSCPPSILEPKIALPCMLGKFLCAAGWLSYLKWDGCHSGVTYETFTGNLWGFFLFPYLLRVTQPSWSILVWQFIKSFQMAHISWFAFLLSAEDVASERGHSVRLQSVPGVGSRLAGLAAGDPRYLVLSIKRRKGLPLMFKWGWVLSIPLQLCKKEFSATLLENNSQLLHS